MAQLNLKELKYESALVLVEVARRALQAKFDMDGNTITSTYATKQEVEALKAVHFEVVPELPETGEPNIIYLAPKSGGSAPNVYDEYIWIKLETETTGHWEKIGSTDIDLSNYVKKTGATSQSIEGNLVLNNTTTSSVKLQNGSVILSTGVTNSATMTPQAGKNVSITLPGISGTLATTDQLTVVDESDINGKINVDGEDLNVYTSPITATSVSIDW